MANKDIISALTSLGFGGTSIYFFFAGLSFVGLTFFILTLSLEIFNFVRE